MSDEKVTEVKNLLKQLNYQEGSIVSKILLKKETGNVTLFAFDTEQGLTEHTSPFDALVQCLEGKMNIKVGKENFIISSGELLTLPATIPHSLKAVEKTKMILIMIKG
ncbi:MAG: cupin domain-containing protein [Ignavibacteriaceae bacterium]